MKISDIQYHRNKTTAIRIRRVYPVLGYESWLDKPAYANYGYSEKPYPWYIHKQGRAMAALSRRLEK